MKLLFGKIPLLQGLIILLFLSLLQTSALGFTRKIVADYSNPDMKNISHYVVLMKEKYGKWVRFEAPFTEACIDGTCTLELDLYPENEYLFKVFFMNSKGNGKKAHLRYKTGKVEPFENNLPVINANYDIIYSSKAMIYGIVKDESHVDVKMNSTQAIQNFGHSQFWFLIDIDGQTSVLLEAKDIHGNIAVTNVNIPDYHYCECDLSLDGKCDTQDWLKFNEDWGRTDCNLPGVDCEGDLNSDGKCDMQDWLKFNEDWGRTDCP